MPRSHCRHRPLVVPVRFISVARTTVTSASRPLPLAPARRSAYRRSDEAAAVPRLLVAEVELLSSMMLPKRMAEHEIVTHW